MSSSNASSVGTEIDTAKLRFYLKDRVTLDTEVQQVVNDLERSECTHEDFLKFRGELIVFRIFLKRDSGAYYYQCVFPDGTPAGAWRSWELHPVLDMDMRGP